MTFSSEEQRLRIRAMADAKVAQVLEQYVPLWTAWAEAEKPRRKTISLCSDFFALKHALGTEQTANPQELIWGLGVSAWQLQLQERQNIVGIEFQYPLITQTMEIGLDERTLALELRPRAVGPQFCFDAFAACQLPNSAEVEKAARAALASSLGRPATPSTQAATIRSSGSCETLHSPGRHPNPAKLDLPQPAPWRTNINLHLSY